MKSYTFGNAHRTTARRATRAMMATRMTRLKINGSKEKEKEKEKEKVSNDDNNDDNKEET